jgi:guanine deaminase
LTIPITSAEERFMKMAIALAIENVRGDSGGPFAAVIVRGEEVVATGVNQVTPTNDPTAHAEIVAIRKACTALATFQLTGCDLYTSCEPCPMCAGAIYWARPARIFYASTAADAAATGFDDSFIFDELRLPPEARHIPMAQLLREESLAAFRAWKESAGRVPY